MALPSVEAVMNVNQNVDEVVAPRGEGFQKAEMADGWYQWMVKKAVIDEVGPDKEGNPKKTTGLFRLNLHCLAVGEDGTPVDGTMNFLNIYLALRNPNDPDRVFDDYIFNSDKGLCRALDPERFDAPRGRKSEGYTYKGAPISAEDAKPLWDEQKEKVYAQLRAWFTEAAGTEEGVVASLERETFYAALESSEWNGRTYQNIGMFTPSATPEDGRGNPVDIIRPGN